MNESIINTKHADLCIFILFSAETYYRRTERVKYL